MSIPLARKEGGLAESLAVEDSGKERAEKFVDKKDDIRLRNILGSAALARIV
jgi:hypothetical protein